MKLPILLFFASTVRLQDTLKGFRFEDNKSKYRWEDGKNGVAQLNFDSFLPPSMTLCLRGKILYNRHGDQNFWFNVVIKHRKPRIGSLPADFGFYHRSTGQWAMKVMSAVPYFGIVLNKEEQDKAKEAKSWPSRNGLLKWAHICFVGDFTKDKTALFLNGKKINETECKFSTGFPDDYYSEELRFSGEILPGFSVEFGRYAFDSAAIIGELLDINAWDHILDEKEMEAITNCKSLELRVGNLINMSSPFNLTGPLCQPMELDMKELSCEETNKDILLPVRVNNVAAAVKQCDRLLKNSIGPFFRTADSYASRYKRMERLPKTEGFKDLCWFGGRVLVWLPYKKLSGKTTWNHITDGSELVWDPTLYVAAKPNAKVEEGDKCLWWYSGPLNTNFYHGLSRDCEYKFKFAWSPCVTCSVPNTIGTLSKIYHIVIRSASFAHVHFCHKMRSGDIFCQVGSFPLVVFDGLPFRF